MSETPGSVPSYLADYADAYAADPREAGRQWFRDARYGLFLHYGLYSLLGRHEWVQYREQIPVAEYAKLAEQFTAEKFDARAIAQFAVDAGMTYVNLTTRHHDSFCLSRTAQTDFQSLNTPCGRDLIGELADACREAHLGLCLYYSHGRDWRHPHAPNNDRWGGAARPTYDPPEGTYATGDEHDLQQYLDFMTAQITELLTQYGPIAAIWLDGIAVPMSGEASAFRCQELYDHIHALQPQVLVSYKQGLLGTEDFFTPEHKPPDRDNPTAAGQVFSHPDKPRELCATMIVDPVSWGYHAEGGRHRTAEEVWDALARAGRWRANILLNTGPLPEGSLDPRDTDVLGEVGRRLREEGFPG